jgi:NAD(P) transhydrogenase
MSDPQHFDILVIGSGPGGEGVAMQAVKHGKQFAVVERFDSIGGGCTHWGTIPSKALRYAIVRILRRNAKVKRQGADTQEGWSTSDQKRRQLHRGISMRQDG